MSQQSKSSVYCHPGRLFIERYGVPTDRDSVLRYPQFLRSEAGLTDKPPVHLSAIYQRFGMIQPLRVPLVDQQGILVDGNTGLILIKEDDAIARQRFTEGHELMELLFDAIEQSDESYTWEHDEKERLCDQGAAELLMPRSQFVFYLQESGISLQNARSLSELYQTSLMATLMRMMDYGSGSSALVIWHPALRKQEQMTQKQMTAAEFQPTKKLRVWWRRCTRDWAGGFIPRNKSVPFTSLIHQVYLSQQAQAGTESISIGKASIPCRIEALPIQCNTKPCVLTLLHQLNE